MPEPHTGTESGARNPTSAGHEDPPLATVAAAVRSAAAYVAISLYVLLVAPPALALVMTFNLKGLLYDLGHLGIQLGLKLAGIRYRVTGREHIPRGRAVVFCANHQSNVDPPILFEALDRRLHVLYKAELSRLPLLGRVLIAGGFVPVERQNREQSFASIARGAESIRSGNSFLIFPEGTRSRTAEMLPFKKGGFIMAIQAQAPIVPVAISGGRAAMRKGSRIIRPVTVDVRIGEPVETAGLTLDERDRVIEEVRARVQQLLQP